MLTSLAIATGVAVVGFLLVWVLCVRIHNYGFLDVAWSLSIAVLAPIYGALGPGDPLRRLSFTAIGALWSLRLGLYVLIRVSRLHPREDARYRTLREKWPGPWQFLAFFELQALIAAVFSLPFLVASRNPQPRFGVCEWVGLTLALLAIAGESLSDWQAQRFKRNPAHRDAVVDVGLWRYSRHPNYFFESLVWWGFFIAALDSAYGLVTLVCPLLMLYLLLNVTGIPLTEKHSLESRGEAYRAYQRRTSRFIPWFRRDA
jgi:steroid 5-alpha reductase family enzyme